MSESQGGAKIKEASKERERRKRARLDWETGREVGKESTREREDDRWDFLILKLKKNSQHISLLFNLLHSTNVTLTFESVN